MAVISRSPQRTFDSWLYDGLIPSEAIREAAIAALTRETQPPSIRMRGNIAESAVQSLTGRGPLKQSASGKDLERLGIDMNERTTIPRLLTRPEAARILGCSTRQIQNFQAQGDLPYVKIRGSIRFKERDLEDFIEARTVRSK